MGNDRITVGRPDGNSPVPRVAGGLLVIVVVASFAVLFGVNTPRTQEVNTDATLPPTTVAETSASTLLTEAESPPFRASFTIQAWDDVAQGPQLSVEQLNPVWSLARVDWIGQVGEWIAAVGPVDQEHWAGGVAVAWSKDGLLWTETHVLSDSIGLRVVDAHGDRLVVVIGDRSAGIPPTEIEIHTWDGATATWSSETVPDIEPMALVVGTDGASLFGFEVDNEPWREITAVLPESVLAHVDAEWASFSINDGSVSLYWNFGLVLWQSSLEDLGLERLEHRELFRIEDPVHLSRRWSGSWQLDDFTFGGIGAWSVGQSIDGLERSGIVPLLLSTSRPSVWWTADGLTWTEGARVDGTIPDLVLHDDVLLARDPAAGGLALLIAHEDGDGRISIVPGEERGYASLGQGSIGADGAAWLIASSPVVQGEDIPLTRDLETISGDLTYDARAHQLVLRDERGESTWDLTSEHLVPDLETESVALVDSEGTVRAEFRLGAISEAFERSSARFWSGSSGLLYTPDAMTWGITELDDGRATTIGAWDGDWLVVTVAADGARRLYRVGADN